MAALQNALAQPAGTEAEWAWVEGLIREVSREERTESLARRVFQWDLAVRHDLRFCSSRSRVIQPVKLRATAERQGHEAIVVGAGWSRRHIAPAGNRRQPAAGFLELVAGQRCGP